MSTSPVALITGASSGIGLGTALLLAEKGYRLSLSARNEEATKQLVRDLIAKGLKEQDVIYTLGDLSAKATAEQLVKKTIDNFGRLDTLINNAGILVGGPIVSCALDDYDKVMDVNVRSVVQLTQLCIPHLIASKGTVVNVSSIAGPCAFPFVAYYCMSKAAIDQFTKCLALEMAGHGVRVNAVNPGVIITDIHKRAGMNDTEYNDFIEKCKTTHALGRPGTVDEVAKAILFLAGPDSSFTTGQLLKIDGGRGIMHPR